MNYHYLTNTPYKEAIEQYKLLLKESGVKCKIETISVLEAMNRVTACAVYAKKCAPHYNACAMDGIAVNARVTFGATETTPVYLSLKDYVRVDTGDPLPDDCDAVVMIENVVEEEGRVKLYSSVVPWQHVRQIGEDISAGDMIFPSYTPITASGIGALLACGILNVDVIKKPIVGIIPTGDEIINPTSNPRKGDIIEFNSAIFRGMLEEEGAKVKVYPIVKDDFSMIKESVEKAVAECDVVILNAGSSAGREDFSSSVINTVGKVIIHGLAIKPGKPTILGLAGTVPVIGVPGYPVSGIIVIDEVINPIIRLLAGREEKKPPTIKAVLSKQINSSLKYHEFVRTRLGKVNGKMIAVPLNRGAGAVSSFMKADGIIEVPQNSEGFEVGNEINVRLLRDEEKIKNSLVITGSHDPLIDEITDLMKIEDKDFNVTSSHVGSMGGIMVLMRREAHLGGIHLLDENSNTYNVSYVKKFFPSGGVILIEGVKRIQGIMVPAGNPLNITGIRDIYSKNLSYVNRQKGSGTRILFDYLLKKENIPSDKIYGYNREEITHTNVAAIISEKSADAGMGIYSAAMQYGLDFINVCEEEYDFLVLEEALKLSVFKKFIELLKSESFKERLNMMGGYFLSNPGRIISF